MENWKRKYEELVATINVAFNGEDCGRNRAYRLVGGRKRFEQLLHDRRIRLNRVKDMETEAQNAKWRVNMADVILNARIER